MRWEGIAGAAFAVGLVLGACSAGGDADDDAAEGGRAADDVSAAAQAASAPTPTRPPTTEPTTTTIPPPLRILIAGDSYSSGEGLDDAQGRCARSPSAYGPLLALELGERFEVADASFAACTAATTRDWPGQRDALDEPPNLIVTTFGGNDVGFVTLMADCIGVDDLSDLAGSNEVDLARVTRLLLGRDCDLSEDEIDSMIDALGPTLDTLYTDMSDVVGEDGNVFVLGYPAPVADPEVWTVRRCEGIAPDDGRVLRRAADRLNAEIDEATAIRPNVHFVDIAAVFDGHGRCSAEPWLFGLLDALGQGTASGVVLTRPFHPSADGHEAMADAVMLAVAAELGGS